MPGLSDDDQNPKSTPPSGMPADSYITPPASRTMVVHMGNAPNKKARRPAINLSEEEPGEEEPGEEERQTAASPGLDISDVVLLRRHAKLLHAQYTSSLQTQTLSWQKFLETNLSDFGWRRFGRGCYEWDASRVAEHRRQDVHAASSSAAPP